MRHFTVPLDLTFVSGFATDSNLLLRLFSPFLCQYSTHLLSFWCSNDDLLSQESSTLNIFPSNLVVNGRPGRWAFCALFLPSQHPLDHLNPRTLDRTSSPCAPRSKLKVWLEVFLNFTHKNIHVYSVLFLYQAWLRNVAIPLQKNWTGTISMGGGLVSHANEWRFIGRQYGPIFALFIPQQLRKVSLFNSHTSQLHTQKVAVRWLTSVVIIIIIIIIIVHRSFLGTQAVYVSFPFPSICC